MPTPEDPTRPATAMATVGTLRHPAPTTTWAVGMLMAMTPCSARDAHRILATAADHADVSPEDLATAMTSASGGATLPAHLERALRHAVEAARTPARAHGPARAGLAPHPARAEEVLTRLRGCQARLAASPQDPAALRAMDDTAYTLCVLMGRPTAHEAIAAAEAHLAASE